MLTLISATRTRLRKPTFPVGSIFPLSRIKSAVKIKAAGNDILFAAPPHYPISSVASKEVIPKLDSVENARSYDMPSEDIEPIVESWHTFFRAWSFNAPWWGGTVAQLSLLVEVVKPKRVKESTNLLTYPAFKYVIGEYIEAHYGHSIADKSKRAPFSGPEQWSVNDSKNASYISVSMLRHGGYIRHILNFFPLDKDHFLCFRFDLYRKGVANGEQEIEKRIPAAPMVKLINEIMSSIELNRASEDESDTGFSDKKFAEEAKANPLFTEKSESFPLLAS